MKTGRIKPNDVLLKSHEMATVVFLTELDKCFKDSYALKRMKVITKARRVIDFSK